MEAAAPVPVRVTNAYRGDCDALMLWGIGRHGHAQARAEHRARGGRVFMWDMGYFGRGKFDGYLRVSIDHEHPQAWLDRSPTDPRRWGRHGIPLRSDADPAGPILLVGMGPKSHAYLGSSGWEARALADLKRRFPERKVMHRPKPGRPFQPLGCGVDRSANVETALRGKSLVVCRHSNVAVDACIAGVPIEVEDGAAAWLQGKPYTRGMRLEFLQRLAWWQWRVDEAAQAWRFLLGMA